MAFDVQAYLALFLFVPVSVIVFATTRRPLAAILGVFLGGLLFLPEHVAFDLPMLPPLDKNGFAAVMGLLGAVLLEWRKLRKTKPLRGVELFFLVVVIGNIGTAMTNHDTLVFGENIVRNGVMVAERRVLPGITTYDVISMSVRDALSMLIPFYLGRALLRSRADADVLLKALVVFGMIYVPLMLFEMRMSPQLHNWVYGYMANKFAHAVRGTGYKPTVFLNNGLAVAMFILAAIVASALLVKTRVKVLSIPAGGPFGILWLALLLSRNVGASLYSVLALPVIFLSRGKLAARFALLIVITVATYPMLRAADLFPAEAMVTAVDKVSPERAHSVAVRFSNEEALYQRAAQRLWFGWGGFGRNRIYDERGKDISITDGEWIIRLGGRGILGFIGSFGLLLAPLLMVRKRIRRVRDVKDRKILDGLTMLVALTVLDLLPNGMFTQLPFFLAGALAGLAHGMSAPSQPSSTAFARRQSEPVERPSSAA